MKLREINKKEFIDFCEDSPSDNFFQSKGWAEVKKNEGYHVYFVGLDQNGKIKAATMILSKEISIFRKRVFYCPRGFVINYKDLELMRAFTKAIKEFVTEKKGVYIRINPYYMLRERDGLGNIVEGGQNNSKCIDILKEFGYIQNTNKNLYKEPKFIYRLDLKGKSTEEILDKSSENLKNIIKRNEEIGISTRIIEKDELIKFLDILKNNTEKMDYLSYDKKKYSNLFDILDKQKMVKVMLAELDIDMYMDQTINSINNTNNPSLLEQLDKQLESVKNLQYKYGHKVLLGGILSITYNEEVTTICNVVIDKFSNFNPLYSLYFDMIKFAKKNSYLKYNFYGVSDSLNSNDKYFNFYKEFNGEVVELLGEYDLVINELFYKREMKKQEKKIKDKKIK